MKVGQLRIGIADTSFRIFFRQTINRWDQESFKQNYSTSVTIKTWKCPTETSEQKILIQVRIGENTRYTAFAMCTNPLNTNKVIQKNISGEDKIVELQAVLPIATGENHKKRTIFFFVKRIIQVKKIKACSIPRRLSKHWS